MFNGVEAHNYTYYNKLVRSRYTLVSFTPTSLTPTPSLPFPPTPTQRHDCLAGNLEFESQNERIIIIMFYLHKQLFVIVHASYDNFDTF